jgi:cell division protease FtsH
MSIRGFVSSTIELEYDVIIKIDNLRRTDFSENQAYTAIHEAGHALVSIIKHQLIPKLIVSKSASTAEGFCRIEFPEIQTKEILYNNILVCLGGRAAEKFILKDSNMLSIGSYSDLANATESANKMIKLYGHGTNPYTIKHTITENTTFTGVNIVDNSELEALEIIKKAELEVDNVLNNNTELLLEMIDYLCNNSQLNEEQLKIMVSKYNLEIKDKDNYYGIRDKIILFKKEELINI